MRYADLLTDTIKRIIEVYDKNAKTKSHKRALLLQRLSRISEMIIIGGSIAYIFCAILHLVNPIYEYFWQNEFKPLFPLYIPFIDEKTANGFTILSSIQIVEIFIAFVASGCADFLFMMLVVNVRMFSTIFEESLIELNEILQKKKVDMPMATTTYSDIWRWACGLFLVCKKNMSQHRSTSLVQYLIELKDHTPISFLPK